MERYGFTVKIMLSILLLILPRLVTAAPEFDIEIRGHLFYPSEFKVPAGEKIKLRVHNTDPTPEEFESYELNREKVIMGGGTATIFVGPLQPGVYTFFGEFYPKTAQGKIVAE